MDLFVGVPFSLSMLTWLSLWLVCLTKKNKNNKQPCLKNSEFVHRIASRGRFCVKRFVFKAVCVCVCSGLLR